MYILTKFDFTMCIEIEFAIENDFGRALSFGDAAFSANMLQQNTEQYTISITIMGGR